MKKIISFWMCVVMLFTVCACGGEDKNNGKIHIKFNSSTANEDLLLADNPDRGFRFEAYVNTNATAYVDSNIKRWNPGFEEVVNSIKAGMWQKPKLVQVYFYLTDFKDTKELPELVFQNIQTVFDSVRKQGQKAVVRFTYQGAIEEYKDQASQDIMFAHMEQLKPILEKNKTSIYAIEAGFLGAWGEWHGYGPNFYALYKGVDEHTAARLTWENTKDFDEVEIIKHILDMAPEGIYVQLRTSMYRDLFLEAYPNEGYEKILGLKNDAYFGYREDTNAWPYNSMSSDAAKSAMKAGLVAPSGGEFFWGCQFNYKRVSGDSAILGFYKFHSSLFSVFHNSFEGHDEIANGDWFKTDRKGDMEIWAETEIKPENLDLIGVPYCDDWFVDSNGKSSERTYFEFVRDHLGYRLDAKSLDLRGEIKKNNNVDIELSLVNYGFAPPFNLTSEFVILNENYEVVSFCPAGDPLKWYNEGKSAVTHKVNASIKLPSEKGKYKLAFSLRNTAGDTAYLASKIDRLKGYNILYNFEI